MCFFSAGAVITWMFFLYPLGPIESSKKPSYLEEVVKEREKKLAEWEKVSLPWYRHTATTYTRL